MVRKELHDYSVSYCSVSKSIQGPSPARVPYANITHRVCVRPSLSSMYSLANGAGGTIVGLICSLGWYCNTLERLEALAAARIPDFDRVIVRRRCESDRAVGNGYRPDYIAMAF